MTITITLTPEDEHRLAARAAQAGEDLTIYIQHLIESDIRNGRVADQALEPFRREVKESGISDEELDSFFEAVRDEVWNDPAPKPADSPVHHKSTINVDRLPRDVSCSVRCQKNRHGGDVFRVLPAIERDDFLDLFG